ncbi:MAG: DUF7285 family protein [Halolamina sp.]
MSSSVSRGQVEPLPALVAVSAFVFAIGLYAGAIPAAQPNDDSDVAERALASVVESASTAGLLSPESVQNEPPNGYEMSVVVRADGTAWRTGSVPPERAPSATQTVLVRTDRGERTGRIRVWVWR